MDVPSRAPSLLTTSFADNLSGTSQHGGSPIVVLSEQLAHFGWRKASGLGGGKEDDEAEEEGGCVWWLCVAVSVCVMCGVCGVVCGMVSVFRPEDEGAAVDTARDRVWPSPRSRCLEDSGRPVGYGLWQARQGDQARQGLKLL